VFFERATVPIHSRNLDWKKEEQALCLSPVEPQFKVCHFENF
jgi:hypothetical protein